MESQLPAITSSKPARFGEVVRTVDGELPAGFAGEIADHFEERLRLVEPVYLMGAELEAAFPHHPVAVTHAYDAYLDTHMEGVVTISCGGGFTQVRVNPNRVMLFVFFLAPWAGSILPLLFNRPLDGFGLALILVPALLMAGLGVVIVRELLKGCQKVADELAEGILQLLRSGPQGEEVEE